jgi:membrane-associated phospholipid phosphatase
VFLTGGLIVFALSGTVAAQGMAYGEAGLFMAIKSLPDTLQYIIWPFMQFGVFITIQLLIIVALVMKRLRLAIAMALGGIGVYVLAVNAKDIVNRARPAALLTGIEGRETFVVGSLSFPSGHAAER